MINIFNMDCMEYLANTKDKAFDLAIVDPPYGASDAINLIDCVTENKQLAKRTNYKSFENIKPTDLYFKELNRVAKKWIVWGGNFFGLIGGVIAWDKKGTAFGEGEIAICNTHNSVRFVEITWNGMLQHDMKNKETRIHPTQKPVALYKWLLQNYAKEGHKILDTHLGSGSIAIACHDLGFDLEACELDKEYFDKAKERLELHQRQLRLF